MLLPAEDEIRKFRDRLEDYGLESFRDLERDAVLGKGGTNKKFEKPEEFVIKILKSEQVISKARILKNLMNIEVELGACMSVCEHWEALGSFVEGDGDPDRAPSGISLLQQILNLALKISLMMANSSTKEQIQNRSTNQSSRTPFSLPALDLKKSLMLFFEKKSRVPSTQQNGLASPKYLNHLSQNYQANQQPLLPYDVLLKLLIKKLQSPCLDKLDERFSENEEPDLKLFILKNIKTIFDED